MILGRAPDCRERTLIALNAPETWIAGRRGSCQDRVQGCVGPNIQDLTRPERAAVLRKRRVSLPTAAIVAQNSGFVDGSRTAREGSSAAVQRSRDWDRPRSARLGQVGPEGRPPQGQSLSRLAESRTLDWSGKRNLPAPGRRAVMVEIGKFASCQDKGTQSGRRPNLHKKRTISPTAQATPPASRNLVARSGLRYSVTPGRLDQYTPQTIAQTPTINPATYPDQNRLLVNARSNPRPASRHRPMLVSKV